MSLFYVHCRKRTGFQKLIFSISPINIIKENISMSKYKYNKDYFNKIDTADKAYWLGFLYADGSINRYYKNEKLRSMTLEIGLADKDRNHLEKFKKCLDSNIPIFERINKLKGKEYKSVRIQLNNTKICYDLCDLGCTPHKTYDIKFPTFDIVPKNFMRDFIRGFFDGDGCISISEMNGKPHIFTTITGMSNMLQSISDFLISEKIIRVKSKIYKDKNSKACSVCFHGTDSNKELLDYLYKDSNVYLDRKYNQYINFYKDYDEKSNKRGVYYDKLHNVYVASIYINGKRKCVTHKNIDDAIKFRKEAEIEKMKVENSPLN